MSYDKFIQPREVGIGKRTFAVSKIPALTAQQIYATVSKSVTDNGIIGITALPPQTVRQILGYTALYTDDSWIAMETEAIINDTFKDNFGDMQELVIEMVKENFGFFVSGKLLEKLVELETETDSE